MTEGPTRLDVYLQEYDKLKDEQTARIGFRDNLLYVTLGAFGGIISFAVSEDERYYVLLVIPWVCLILGWTYLVNDEKISALGRYMRNDLVNKIQQCMDGAPNEPILGWEVAHRSDPKRRRRKIEQLIIDEITFVVSGIIGIGAFCVLASPIHWGIQALLGLELLLLLVLGAEI